VKRRHGVHERKQAAAELFAVPESFGIVRKYSLQGVIVPVLRAICTDFISGAKCSKLQPGLFEAAQKKSLGVGRERALHNGVDFIVVPLQFLQ